MTALYAQCWWTVASEAMSDYLLKKLPAQVCVKDYSPHTYGGKAYDVGSAAAVVEKANIGSVAVTEVHGRQAFTLNLKTAVAFTYSPAGEAAHTASISQMNVRLEDVTTNGIAQLVPLSDPLVKAGWNFFLIEGDASNGVHNPTFTKTVLDSSIKALK